LALWNLRLELEVGVIKLGLEDMTSSISMSPFASNCFVSKKNFSSTDFSGGALGLGLGLGLGCLLHWAVVLTQEEP